MVGVMGSSIVETAALGAGALALYAVLVWLASEYSRRTNWQPPEGASNADWSKRRSVGISSGALAVALCAVCCVAFLDQWPARLMTMAQATLMAAAGSSDLHRFHLPLPFTLAGIGLAVALAFATQQSALVWLFALLWATAAILLHTLSSKGSMQLGDHIATVWIALAAPFNGLLAIIAGDLANVIVARAGNRRNQKVAAAGAWLIMATGIIALPPYVAWFTGQAATTTRTPDGAISALAVGNRRTAAQAETAGDERLVKDTLAEWARQAAYQTARVALEDHRAGRITAARFAASEVKALAVAAEGIAPGSDVANALQDLGAALSAYDVNGVRDASWRLAEARERFSQVTFEGKNE